MKEKRYITTTLPYVNAKPHVGFAKEIIQADVWARFWREIGHDVFFNTGTDEHGQKIYQKALELGKTPQEYCDELVESFRSLKALLNLSYNSFIRTTDEQHIKAAQEFWKICDQNGFIYKKNYKIKYCVGCELEKTESELIDGHCPDHPNLELEIREEENYFFQFSQFGEKLKALYEKNPDLVQPSKRFAEIKSFVDMGLEDFSISRLKSKMPWGIDVPGDSEQVMYVWFDALVNYISTLGWPQNRDNFEKFWPGKQICGKDNLRQQSAMWQAMLMAAGLPNSNQIYVNGFINSGGQKMSKSLGNVISPEDMVARYGVDGTRYLLLAMGSFGEDVDLTWENMDEKYNADLANGLGNLVSRVLKLAQQDNFQFSISNFQTIFQPEADPPSAENDSILKLFNDLQLGHVLEYAWNSIRLANKYIDDNKPWELVKSDKKKFEEVMNKLLEDISKISVLIIPLMPETAEKIKKALESKQVEPLFQRIK